MFFPSGVSFLTLIVNGSKTDFLLNLLGMDKTYDTKIRILHYTRYEMKNKGIEASWELVEDEEWVQRKGC